MAVTSSAEAPLLSIEGLSVYYQQFRALHGIDIAVGQGEIVSIIGANGAGKSSLLKAIVSQVDRIEGRIQFAGANIANQPTPAIVASGIALVPEGRRLFPSLTVEENLEIGWQIGRKGSGVKLSEVFDLFPVLREKRRQPAEALAHVHVLAAGLRPPCRQLRVRQRAGKREQWQQHGAQQVSHDRPRGGTHPGL